VCLGCALGLSASCATEPPPKSPAHAHHAKAKGKGTARTPSPPLAASAPVPEPERAAPPPPHGEPELAATYASRRILRVEKGEASYYGSSLAGHQTASGERYDPRAFTAAHRTLALGSVVRVIRVDTGAAVYVRITDRGPFGSAHRIIDLSNAAAEQLDMLRRGVAEVRLELLEVGPARRRRR
jgi:rare lipoprotein A